jgi:hypothetical protein
MLKEVKPLHGWTIHGLDGELGSVDEMLFDDEHWTIRYLIVNTGSWLLGRKVLISPLSFDRLDWENQTLNVNLTCEKIKNSPGVEAHQPVSRQWETGYYDYYEWPYYWEGASGRGVYGYPGPMLARDSPMLAQELIEGKVRKQAPSRTEDHIAAHLRSTLEVTGYGISATDGHLGHVSDFILNDDTWSIAYLVIDTQDWWPGKKVLLPPHWIDHVSWLDKSVTVKVTRDQVQNAPQWEPGQDITNDFQDQTYDHYLQKRPDNSGQKLPSAFSYTDSLGKEAKDVFVSVYDTHSEAESAVQSLSKRGFDMTKLSIVGKDYHVEEEVVGYYTAGDRMMAWGATGAFWGGMWSLLFGSAFFLVPGFGPILAAGPVVVWIVGALESAVVVGGFSALGGALFSVGIPNDSIVEYETQIKAGKFLVIAHDIKDKKDTDMIAQEAHKHSGRH